MSNTKKLIIKIKPVILPRTIKINHLDIDTVLLNLPTKIHKKKINQINQGWLIITCAYLGKATFPMFLDWWGKLFPPELPFAENISLLNVTSLFGRRTPPNSCYVLKVGTIDVGAGHLQTQQDTIKRCRVSSKVLACTFPQCHHLAPSSSIYLGTDPANNLSWSYVTPIRDIWMSELLNADFHNPRLTRTLGRQATVSLADSKCPTRTSTSTFRLGQKWTWPIGSSTSETLDNRHFSRQTLSKACPIAIVPAEKWINVTKDSYFLRLFSASFKPWIFLNNPTRSPTKIANKKQKC